MSLVSGARVRCVGDLLTDVVAHVPADLALGSDTRGTVRLTGGGAAANTAAWLAALGTPVALSARVGDDVAGRALVADLAERGVDVDGVEVDDARATGACLVLLDPDGERTMVPDAGAAAHLAAVPVDGDEHLHVSAYALFHATARDVVRAAARAAGTVSLDVASAAPLAELGADVVRGWCAGALVLANLDEAVVLTGTDDPAAAARTLAGWGRAAVVKAGSRGAWCAEGDAVDHVPVPSAVDTTDTTGAGDAFAAGLLAALVQGATLTAAAARGHKVAARAVAGVGARP